MKTKVFLVRHGKTEWNKLRKIQGSQDIGLSEEGVMQANYLSEKFNGNFDLIYTSPLKRAIETANIISKNTNLEPIVIDDLREINFGKWESLTFKEVECKFPEEFEKWRNDKIEGPLCGGDVSVKKAGRRFKNAIEPIVSKNAGKDIVFVAHGGIILAGLIAFFNWDMTMYHKISLENAAICELHFDSNLNPEIIKLNC